MARGFSDIKRSRETTEQRVMRQNDYDYLERLYELDIKRTTDARIWFRRPAYCIGERRLEWEKILRSGITE